MRRIKALADVKMDVDAGDDVFVSMSVSIAYCWWS